MRQVICTWATALDRLYASSGIGKLVVLLSVKSVRDALGGKAGEDLG